MIVVGAQGRSEPLLHWLRRIGSSPQTEVLMSVCTGAFKLAEAGLLEGKHATTHHDFLDAFAQRYPGVTLECGPRRCRSLSSSAGCPATVSVGRKDRPSA